MESIFILSKTTEEHLKTFYKNIVLDPSIIIIIVAVVVMLMTNCGREETIIMEECSLMSRW